VLDPIDRTITFARDGRLCSISLSLVVGDSRYWQSSVRRCLRSGSSFGRDGHVPQRHEGLYCGGCRPAGGDHRDHGHQSRNRFGGENRVHLAVLARLAHESLRVRMLGSAALDLVRLAAGRRNATLMLSNLPWDVTAGCHSSREASGVVHAACAVGHTKDRSNRACITSRSISSGVPVPKSAARDVQRSGRRRW